MLADTSPQKEERIPEPSKNEASIPQAKKIDLDSALLDEVDEYLIEFEEGVLDICCYDLLEVQVNRFYFEKSIETYEIDEVKETVWVYRAGNSFFKQFNNNDPSVMSIETVSGKIRDNEALLKGDINIGMQKGELLSLLFKGSLVFLEVNSLKVSRDEFGNTWTSYIFEEDTLKEILFDSDYDWIKKEL
ncbi:MAG: hypothetical protein AAGD28_21170 [Bacteroidota bacterium]